MVDRLLSGLLWVVLLIGFAGHGQTEEIDRLSKLLRKAEGEAFFQTSNDLAFQYLEYKPSKSLELANVVLTHEEVANYPAEEARAQFLKARAFSIQGDYSTSYGLFDKGLEIYERLGDEFNIAESLLGKGIAYAYHSKYEEAREAFKQSLNGFVKLENESGQARVYNELGHLEYLLRNEQKALAFFKQAIDLNEKLGNKKALSNDLFRIGINYHSMGDDGKALESFTQSKALKEEVGDLVGLSKLNISLGVFHEEHGNYDTAKDYYLQSLDFNEQLEDKRISAIILNNMGILYEDWGKYDSAVVYHKQSFELRKLQNNQRGMVQSLANIGEAYRLGQNIEESLNYFRKAYETSQSNAQKPMFSYINDKLGELFLQTDRLDSAEYYLKEALVLREAGDNYYALRGTYRNLSELAEKRRDYQKSLEYFKAFKKVQDSFFQSRKNRELAEIQAKYDTERQEKEIIGLQQENRERTLWRNIFAVGTLLTLGLVLLLFQFFLYRNKKNKELLEAKEAQRVQLEEMDKLKSRFFSNISHEFRTPLTLILGPLEGIRKELGSALAPKIDVIERNGKRLLKLINQLLDLSKIEAGKVALRTSLTDVVPLLKGWVMSFHSLAEAKGIRLDFKSQKEAFLVYVDQEKLEEVMVNLMSNALKFTSEGGQITVTLIEKELEDQKVLSISVADSGAGISKEELEHIFDRFYQAANSSTQTGTGIGLSLVRELVELHKGSINVRSETGKGSTFEFLLLFGKAHLKEEEIVRVAVNRETTLVPDMDEPSIEPTAIEDKDLETNQPIALVVEDNKDLRRYIHDILSGEYRVLEAVDGEEGLAAAIQHTPDIIISDLMMPKMDGISLCKSLKENMGTSHIPVILLTAKASKEDKIEGLKSLADDYLTKPFNTEELLVRLRNLIAVRKKMQAAFGQASSFLPKQLHLNSMDTLFMEKVSALLEEEISNPLYGVSELSKDLGLSRSQLFRKVKAITDLTPNEFIRSFRLFRAMDLLKQQSATVTEVAYEVGFQNPSYFTKCFQEQFGMVPSAVSKA